MKASLKWLQSLVPGLTGDSREVSARFTAAGLEIESMHTFGAGAEACVVARVAGVRTAEFIGGRSDRRVPVA